MADTGPPQDLAARLASAEQRLAIYGQFPREQLGVLSAALRAAEEVRAQADKAAAELLDRTRLDLTALDQAIAALRASHPQLAQALALARGGAPAPEERALPRDVASLQAELESARKRLSVYEEFEDTIQSVVTAAMRAAHEIRTRSEEEASSAVERIRTETRAVRDELSKLRGDRDALGVALEELQRARDALASQREELAGEVAELRAEADRLREARGAGRGVLEERRPPRLEALPARPSSVVEPQELIDDVERLRQQRGEMIKERDYQADEVRRLRAERDAVAQQLAGLREAFAAALQQLVRAVGQPGAAPVAASAAAPAPAPAAPAAPAQVAAESEVRLVISPVPSFSELVQVERGLHGFAGIRSVYVRDYRSGIATLICNVTVAMSMQDLADTLARELDCAVERVAEGVIELKVREKAKEKREQQSG